MNLAELDADELRALAVAVGALDGGTPPPDWDGDPDAFERSVRRGRARLEERGVAEFARDGSATIRSDLGPVALAYLAPAAVVESFSVDEAGVRQREWYIGPAATVVADPTAASSPLDVIDSAEVFNDVFAFIALVGRDATGDPIHISASELDDFRGRPADEHRPSGDLWARYTIVIVAWDHDDRQRELQVVDAGTGGIWVVRDASTNDDGEAPGGASPRDRLELYPTTRAQLITLLLETLAPPLDPPGA